MKTRMTKIFTIEVSARIPVSEKGVMVHTPKKGKGSYSRKSKYNNKNMFC